MSDEKTPSRRIGGKDLHEFLATLPKEQVERLNREAVERTERDYASFIDAFGRGECSLCGESLTHFDRNKPCLHWLTRPPGFKGKDIRKLGEQNSLRQVQAYLHWLGSVNEYGKSINNLRVEGKEKMVVGETIRWEDMEFSISCTEADFVGHGKNAHSQQPHYHLQILSGGQIFCKFSQHHLPISNQDVAYIEAERMLGSKFRRAPVGAVSMEDIFSIEAETLLDEMRSTENEEEAMFSLNTMVMADEGTTISGDVFVDAIERARERGSSIAKELQGLKNARVAVT